MKIVHITSAHPVFDSRIFYKECMTLVNAGYEVHLVALESDQKLVKGIKIHALNSEIKLTRWKRLFKIYQLAKSIPADIYHFHDPEFILFALLLKTRKVKVCYDVHEDTPVESYSFNKHTPFKAKFKSLRWRLLEKIAKLFFDGFVCATPHIAKKFPSKKTIIVRNYVKMEEFDNSSYSSFSKRPNSAIYVGGIMESRGLKEMVSVLQEIPSHYLPNLKLIGKFSPSNLKNKAIQFKGWDRVISLGWISREHLAPHFYSSKVGLLLLHPEKNFQDALPIKLFEYMSAGLPVIASDFPIWREIILTSGCGFVLNPFDIDAIREKLCFLFDNPIEAEKMGRAGRDAAFNLYNWQSEAKELTHFYESRLRNKIYE